MATILRNLSYRYQWLYDGISRAAALLVGGEGRFRRLALDRVEIGPETRVLDLCCGAGQTTRFVVERSRAVTGLDASEIAVERARRQVPGATYVQGWAERLPFGDGSFEVVHASAALHEMEPEQLRQILIEVHRVLVPGGMATFVDFHRPTVPLLWPILWPGLALFLWLFETETSWQFIRADLVQVMEAVGFERCDRALHAGGTVQAVRGRRSPGPEMPTPETPTGEAL